MTKKALITLPRAAWAALLISVCIFGSSLLVRAEEDHHDARDELASPETTDEGVNKFEQFKTMFNRHYNSLAEELRRKALFWSNSFAAFVSQMKYKHKQSSSFLAVTDMSDWTPDEFQSTLMDADEYYRESVAELNSGDLQFQSTGAASDAASATLASKIQAAAKGALDRIGKSAGDFMDKADRFLESASNSLLVPKVAYRPDLPDEVFIDHRRGGCLNEIRSQGQCGSCYSFATISYYEWAYCRATNERIAFSEQYIVDCGHLTGLSGCKGGHEMRVSRFIKKYGLELRNKYDYIYKESTCPYNTSEVPTNKMGAVRMDKPELVTILPYNVEKELKTSPLIVTIFGSPEFQHYGGGLDEGKACERPEVRKRLHLVLLVGSGRQDGHEYWLIRNSYGTYWGENGYYKLRKDSTCIADFHIANKLKEFSKGEPKYKFTNNPVYDKTIVERSKSQNSYSRYYRY